MKRYLLFLGNSVYRPKDVLYLKEKARTMISHTQAVVRDTRVSNRYVEYDISIPDNEDISNFANQLSTIAPLIAYDEIIDKHREKHEAIAQSVHLFNEEKYWSAHEILESVWKLSRGNEKDLLNGIILLSAAFVHDEKNEPDICISILKRALKKLESSSGIYYGIQVDEMKNRIRSIIETENIKRFSI